jgi:exosortase/archaeosortase family protein
VGSNHHTGNQAGSSKIVFILAGICAFLLIFAGQKVGWISVWTQELLTFALEIVGVAVSPGDDGFKIGNIWVPWSPGCSGYNGLILCVILTLWLSRHDKINQTLVLRLLGTIPAALAANILRIGCILGYRYLAYPSDETPEIHFLIGFLTLLPAAYLLNLTTIRKLSPYHQMEIGYFAIIFSLLIPITWEPGGWQVTLTVFSLLALYHGVRKMPHMGLVTLWISFGCLIGLAKMESLWLPWSILCPLFVRCETWIRRPTAWLLLLSTMTMLVMQPYWYVLLGLALVFEWSQPHGTLLPQDESGLHVSWKTSLTASGLLFPFLMPIIPMKQNTRESIPPNAIVHTLKTDQCLIRFVGQNEQLSIFWYEANNEGRHHAAATCMQFSGSEFERIKENLIATDSMWVYEQFIVNGKRLNSYREYLIHTWQPWKPSGAHLIFTGTRSSMDQEAFEIAVNQALERWFPNEGN